MPAIIPMGGQASYQDSVVSVSRRDGGDLMLWCCPRALLVPPSPHSTGAASSSGMVARQ